MRRFSVGCCLLILAVMLFVPESFGNRKAMSDGTRRAMIGELVAVFLENNHYSKHELLDPATSEMAFDRLLDNLDPNKMFFTAEDLKAIEAEKRSLAAEIADGNVSSGKKIYNMYRRRFSEYRNYALELLESGIDFSRKEYVELDREKAEPFATDEEMRDFWRKKIKNDLLYFRLLQRSMTEENSGEVETSESEKIKKLWEVSSPEEKLKRRLHDISNVIEQTDDDEILEILLTALAQVYGPHSAYYSPGNAEDFDIDMSLSLTGIGATLSSADGFTRIVALVPGGPAEKDGTLQPEDRIIAVAQEGEAPVDVIDMALDKVVSMIRGPEGSRVTLTYLPGRKGRNAVPQSVTLERSVVELKESEVTGTVKTVPAPDGSGKSMKIGVVEFNKFYVDFEAMMRHDPDFKSCARDMRRELEKLKAENVEAVVIDLRYNTGGGLTEALTMSGFFIKDGPLLQIRGADGEVAVENDADPGIVYDGPLVILASSMTASAAEILTGTVRDYQRGIIVGDNNTFGKGTVLNVVKLDDLFRSINLRLNAGSLQYENAIFFGVSGSSNQQLGIKADIVLPSLTDEMPIGESYSPNHLPWERIAARKYEVWDPAIADKISVLEKASKERRAADPEFQLMEQEIANYKRYQQKKQVSLNEEERWEEYMSEKTAAEQQEKLLPQIDGGDGKDDPLLDEAVFIAADYAVLLKSE